MDKKEMKRLEKEREKLEAAREKLEQERERMEEEHEKMEEEHERMEEDIESGHEKRKERIIIKHGEHDHELTEEQQEKLDKAMEKLDKAQIKIDLAMDGLDDKIENSISGIDFDKINETVEKAMAGVDKHSHDIDIEIGRVTKNIGVLNLKGVTEEELEKMGDIKNTGVIIVPEELMSKVSSKIIKNIGTIVPYKKGWRIYSGHTSISKAMLDAIDEPLEFIQTGHLEIDDDVSEKLIKDKVKAFHNYGHINATEETYGVLMAKCLENYGDISKNGDDDEDDD
ncbi:MAG: hypothetical protein KAJ33_05165 [Thermoplasmata archaeon]|nr:hypothetical protein [Thermoplasmata archaeon]